MSDILQDEELEGIAIIGMSCYFPGADNVEEFWRNLKNGVESVSFFTEQELLVSGVTPAVLHNPNYVRASAILEHGELFAASFFGFNQRDAELMEPQHRLFFECAHAALEHAGYNAEHYDGLIGLWAGAGENSYLFNIMGSLDRVSSLERFQIAIGNEKDFLATRIAYKLNLKGPCVTVQSACSTSLVAVHMACQSLLSYDCDMALAGGVSMSSPQKIGSMYQEGGIISPDGHCRAFDASAQGFVRGNGAGIVVLKRLGDALADGDYIHAVIRGSAVNNDGAMKIGFTAPGIEGQSAVIATAQSVAKANPETITYIEAHGTGTLLGDPIEVAALTKVFRTSTQKKQFCALGSVKTNIGHLDTAAGVAGLIKTVLALEHKLIPPSLLGVC
jgi:acyl transferase domain-containing protein